MKATRKLIPAIAMLLVSAVMLSTASFAWFTMNTEVKATGMKVTATSDSTFLQIGADGQYGNEFHATNTDKKLGLTVPVIITDKSQVNLFAATPVNADILNSQEEFDNQPYYIQTASGHLIKQPGVLHRATDLANYYTKVEFSNPGEPLKKAESATINASNNASIEYWLVDSHSQGGYKKVVVSTALKSDVTVEYPQGAIKTMTENFVAGSGKYVDDGLAYFEAISKDANADIQPDETVDYTTTTTTYEVADKTQFHTETIFAGEVTYAILKDVLINDNPAYTGEVTKLVDAKENALNKDPSGARFIRTSEIDAAIQAYVSTDVIAAAIGTYKLTETKNEFEAAILKAYEDFDAAMKPHNGDYSSAKAARNTAIDEAFDILDSALTKNSVNIAEAQRIRTEAFTKLDTKYDQAIKDANDACTKEVEKIDAKLYPPKIKRTNAKENVVSDGETEKCFVKSPTGNNYYKLACGKQGIELVGQVAWFTANSSDSSQVQAGNEVVPVDDMSKFALYNKFDMKLMGEVAAADLKISGITVENEQKINDGMYDAVRVLLVIKKTNGQNVVTYKTVEYDVGQKKYFDPSTARELNDTILFDSFETTDFIEFGTYIYYCGTDEVSMTDSIGLGFRGYDVEIRFSITQNK